MTEPLPPYAAGQARVAFSVLQEADETVREGMPADTFLRKLFHQHRNFGSRDRRFVSELIFSWFRWRGWLGQISSEPTPATAAAAYLLDATEPAPAIDHLVLECRTAGIAVARQPMGALGLSEKAEALAECFPGHAFTGKTLVPEWVLDALPPGLDPETLVLSFQRRPPTWLRCRDTAELCASLDRQRIPWNRHARVQSALAIDPSWHLAQALKSMAGRYEIQDIASQAVGMLCAPEPGQRWWDACAGSGGKTLHLAELLDGHGAVLATDVRDLSREFERRVATAGYRGISAIRLDAATTSPQPAPFDGILVDAPCSGVGTWSRNPDARWRIQPEDILAQSVHQAAILANAGACLKVGGILVYSVCTLTDQETNGVVHTFLERHPGISLDPFLNPLTGEAAPGILQLLPADGPGDGMFIARFRKNC